MRDADLHHLQAFQSGKVSRSQGPLTRCEDELGDWRGKNFSLYLYSSEDARIHVNKGRSANKHINLVNDDGTLGAWQRRFRRQRLSGDKPRCYQFLILIPEKLRGARLCRHVTRNQFVYETRQGCWSDRVPGDRERASRIVTFQFNPFISVRSSRDARAAPPSSRSNSGQTLGRLYMKALSLGTLWNF
ncbi:hypothetical protein EVAR_83683_1 [Eumeta japonica]|uniref:Uncharacterized protein n=1 Tax=Eumeta variegata TaxID=151549 RepID=A0A4C1Y2I4_EUMVA|nr:hypothetical protein EVAR_83683_1 [Eumeta japonica]